MGYGYSRKMLFCTSKSDDCTYRVTDVMNAYMVVMECKYMCDMCVYGSNGVQILVKF